MAPLWDEGDLAGFLPHLIRQVGDRIEQMSEDELLSQPTEDLVEALSVIAVLDPLAIGADRIDGSVDEVDVDVSHDITHDGDRARGLKITAVYEFKGDRRLFDYLPDERLLERIYGEVGDGTIKVWTTRAGTSLTPEQAEAALAPVIDRIQTMAGYASSQAEVHNAQVPDSIRRLVEDRKERVRNRRDLAGALGFPLEKRADAPPLVPVKRKPIGVARRETSTARPPYADEPALSDQIFEDAIGVVRSTIRAMECTPSVASGKLEEDLRDQILVQLNGTFEGAATGETFVQSGKTDILLREGDRHVFVGECKWWSGAKDCGAAVDQLLGYLPWRDEKAVLVMFIDRKDATAAIGAADESIRKHAAFKRIGPDSPEPDGRRNYVLGHPDDLAREIHLAVLFAVLPKEPRT